MFVSCYNLVLLFGSVALLVPPFLSLHSPFALSSISRVIEIPLALPVPHFSASILTLDY